jgi:hypothetical protein
MPHSAIDTTGHFACIGVSRMSWTRTVLRGAGPKLGRHSRVKPHIHDEMLALHLAGVNDIVE